jgi:hypothetical protein
VHFLSLKSPVVIVISRHQAASFFNNQMQAFADPVLAFTAICNKTLLLEDIAAGTLWQTYILLIYFSTDTFFVALLF